MPRCPGRRSNQSTVNLYILWRKSVKPKAVKYKIQSLVLATFRKEIVIKIFTDFYKCYLPTLSLVPSQSNK
jgi:hypothetical protein